MLLIAPCANNCPWAQIFCRHAAAKVRQVREILEDSYVHARFQEQKHLLFIFTCSLVVLYFISKSLEIKDMRAG